MSTEELFSRQIPVFSEVGQQKLREATVLIIGCGGLGSTVSTVLSRSGVGKLVMVDRDTVSLSNIHRQLLYSPDDIGKLKSETAAKNPLLCLSQVIPVVGEVTADFAFSLIREHNPICVMDCTDNFDVRYAINAACVRAGVPMVFGSITAGQGQVSVFCADENCPCFACIHPNKPEQLPTPPPVIPAICTTIGTLEAMQAINIIIGVGDSLKGKLLTFDLLHMKMRTFSLRQRDPHCHVCGNMK